jgi:hypothetical protein
MPIPEYRYSKSLNTIANRISQPEFPDAVRIFLHSMNHPNTPIPETFNDAYDGPISVIHSASACYYAPSDLCGSGGMYRERIRANPSYLGSRHCDTVLVDVGGEEDAMKGLLVAQVLLFFSCWNPYTEEDIPCALVRWFEHPDGGPCRDGDTGMWKVVPEMYGKDTDEYPIQVISLDTILRRIHLLPNIGPRMMPHGFSYENALDAFKEYYVNQFIDYHAHELLY